MSPGVPVLPIPGLDTTTQSPLLRVVTSAPTEVTTPTPSPPPTAGKGGLIAYTPKKECFLVIIPNQC